MNKMKMITRKEGITEIIRREDVQSLKPEENITIPDGILERIGNIKNIRYPKQGYCGLVMKIETEDRDYILKVAKGRYRCDELKREYMASKILYETEVSVPEGIIFIDEGDRAFFLKEYSEGITLSDLFFSRENEGERLYYIRHMAEELRKIHRVAVDGYTYDELINEKLYFAREHLERDTIDHSDFIVDGKNIVPEEELEWLENNKPSEGKVSIIHGDYKPKNIIWKNDKIESIVDWAFVDLGDPYYDIALLFYYFNHVEKEAFMKAYGIEKLDEERLEYFERLIPFLNI